MRSLQVRCGRILLAAMVSLGLVIPVEAAEEKRGALGAYLEYRDDGVFVSRVVDHLGAGIAGIQPGDRIISVGGKATHDREDFVFDDPICTVVPVTIERDGQQLTKDTMLIPIKTPGDCLGYYKFTTESHQEARELGKEIYAAVLGDDGGGSVQARLRGASGTRRLNKVVKEAHFGQKVDTGFTPMDTFVAAFEEEFELDVSRLRTYAGEITDHLDDNLPETGGHWEPVRWALRVTNHRQVKKGGHMDFDHLVVTVALTGVGTRYDPLGCLGQTDDIRYDDFAGSGSHAVALTGRDRFKPWDLHKLSDAEREDALQAYPAEFGALVRACWETRPGKSHWYHGVPHEKPEYQEKRVLLVIGYDYVRDR